MNIKIKNENLISSDRYITENCNDLNEIIKLKNEERKKIILLSEITKIERRIASSKVNVPCKVNDELRKKISLKHQRNKNIDISRPINSINNIMIVNNYRIQNFRTEKSSVNFDNLDENINSNNNSINYIDINKSQVSDIRKRLNKLCLFSPKKESTNIEVKIGGLESDRNIFHANILNTEGNVMKEEKKIIRLNESGSKNKIFKFRNLNDEEREKIRKDLELKLKRQKSEIKKRERENSEKLKKEFLQELIKKKEKN